MVSISWENELAPSQHNLQIINENSQSAFPTGEFFICPTPKGEPYAVPWQTQPAILNLNFPPENHQQIFNQIIARLKQNKPYLLATEPAQQTNSRLILVHGVNLSSEGLNLLVSVQPDVLPEGSIQIYPTA